MPRSGPRVDRRHSDNNSSDDIFVSPNRNQRKKPQRRGDQPSRKRERETDSKQVDRAHRKQSRTKDEKMNPSKKTGDNNESIRNGSENYSFTRTEPSQHPKNNKPIQQGQRKKQSRKKKHHSNPNAAASNQEPKHEQNIQRDQKKNKHQNKKNQNHSTRVEPVDDIFAERSQQQSRRTNGQKAQETTIIRKNSKRTQGGKKDTQQHNHEVPAAMDGAKNKYKSTLEWDSPVGYVPLSEEKSIVEFMFQRNGKRERGMLKNKPDFVVSKYRKAMHQRAPSMTFPQVLSLRRHHIKLNNQFKDMTQLGLGKIKDINASARLFECAIERFLKKSSIDFRTEEDQKKEAKEKNEVLRATPDFVLPKPIVLRKTGSTPGKKGKSNKEPKIIEERTIHWIEAKMYYGASSIPHGSKGAVGTVLQKAKSYVDTFGEGAILFMMGCGDKLAAEMNDIGVIVLDCSGKTVCLDRVHDHQRTWCANEKGHILP